MAYYRNALQFLQSHFKAVLDLPHKHYARTEVFPSTEHEIFTMKGKSSLQGKSPWKINKKQ